MEDFKIETIDEKYLIVKKLNDEKEYKNCYFKYDRKYYNDESFLDILYKNNLKYVNLISKEYTGGAFIGEEKDVINLIKELQRIILMEDLIDYKDVEKNNIIGRFNR